MMDTQQGLHTSVRQDKYVLNAQANPSQTAAAFRKGDIQDVIAHFRASSIYSVTPLRRLSTLARILSLRDLLVKDESCRMSMPSFKILGVSYAIERLLREGALRKDTVLAAATDGNHGAALAFEGRRLGLPVHIYIHEGAAPARIAALEQLGARVRIVPGNYDDSVTQAADDARANGWTVISDTAWTGYEKVPRYIMAGYTMMMTEAASQWPQVPDLLLVQAGVGGLLGSVLTWSSFIFPDRPPAIVSCEPDRAACVFESIRSGKPVQIEGARNRYGWPQLRSSLLDRLASAPRTTRRLRKSDG